ncbi:prenyltransferase/squalene oxidase repeat-containing protein [Zavarzinella formosa]|uniref:prenyltransferase/squalene oxidase repeat-containing protein n=1 Tax=Zavarzinella formosa TaxID=360055 RepID=UPI00035E8FFE|nr:prenyltransferase/squalene oxidase repeat-containing protein [Zavarzinella formosa]
MRLAAVGVLLLVASVGMAQAPADNAVTIRYVLSLRQPDGGFVSHKPDPKGAKETNSSLRATSAAVRAIKYLGGELPNRELTAKFVESCYDPASGTFADTPKGKGDITLTAVGMMAAAELLPKFDYDPAIRYLTANAKTFEERRIAVAGMEAGKKFAPVTAQWFAETEKTRNPDGTYGKGDALARDTGGTAAMIVRAGGKIPAEQLKAVVAAIQNGQRADGGFGKAGEGSDLETSYRVMRAMYLLKIEPKDPAALRQFLSMCANKDGGYAVQPGNPSGAGSTYYAAAIMGWMKK